ncbi:TetR/AcrR family transcriptional regulator [Microbacterium sp. KUDC0406]|uniref:TetR/AcrR family transcriptional regulator n=1 Tax=Microbacterium sp. KUDC0406 TaxID=2909588 RepID=UPI001F2104E0|nr:TetR/AcrR family transcriptional regulator [Microbacterium sp. KUDC0406]UJP10190.1 TetR/AcrR family transcriptional regulator [Microbacterium sp. KUDC0406]
MDLDDGVRRRRGRELEDAILTAAWDQLLQGGYGNFTIDAVADRADTSRSVVYRRWPDRIALVEAAVTFGLQQDRPSAPDTGSLRGDMIEMLRRVVAARREIAPLVSVFIGAYFSDSGHSFADLRRRAFGEGVSATMTEIFERAAARGELDPARLTPRVQTVATDLLRHDMLMTLRPSRDEDLAAIVDEIFLPLVSPL